MIAQIDKAYIQTRPTKLFSRLFSYALFEGRPITTKGQWLNPLLFFLFRIEKRLPQLKTVEKPIFILGTGRSGTTLLGTLLSMHKDVGFLNEPKALWHSIYAAEDLAGSYTLQKAFYRLNAQHVSNNVKKDAHRLFGAYLTATCSSRIVDKYPELIFRVPFVKEIFPDAKFLFLVRNGWDTCSSIANWSERAGAVVNQVTHDWWGRNNRKWGLLVDEIISPDPYYQNAVSSILGFHDHFNMATVEWIATMREGIKMMREYPDDILMIRFEDMTNNTLECFRRIVDFCELREDNKMMEYAEKKIIPISSHPKKNIHSDIYQLFMNINFCLGISAEEYSEPCL